MADKMNNERWTCLQQAAKSEFVQRYKWGDSAIKALARLGYIRRITPTSNNGKWVITDAGRRRLNGVASRFERQWAEIPKDAGDWIFVKEVAA